MNTIFFILMLFGLQLFCWFVGKRSASNLESKKDYFLAGKSVRFFPLFMTFLATQVGGGLVLGSADEAFRFGWWASLCYPVGMAMGLVALGLGLGRRLAAFPVSTVAEVLEVAYRSAFLKKAASLLSMFSLFMILVAQVLASRKFLVAAGFTSIPLFIALWAIIILYTVRGGLRAVISTDLVQAAFFSIAFLFCLGFVAYQGNVPSLSDVSFAAIPTSKLAGWLLLPSLFMVIGQDMGQRCFAGKCAKTVSRACICAGLGLLILCIVPIFFGVLARKMEIVIPEGASVLMVAVAKVTNPWVAAILGCAILAAIVSTATSLISAMSSNLVNDFTRKKESLLAMQGMTALFAIGAVFFAFSFDSVIGVLLQSYELSVGCLFVPVVMALFKREGNFLSGLLSMVFGLCGFCLFKAMPIAFPAEIATVLLSFAGYYCGEVRAYFETSSVAR